MYRDRYIDIVEASYIRCAKQFGKMVMNEGQEIYFSANPDFNNFVKERYLRYEKYVLQLNKMAGERYMENMSKSDMRLEFDTYERDKRRYEFELSLNTLYVNHYSRGLRNRKAILQATTALKGVGVNAEGY